MAERNTKKEVPLCNQGHIRKEPRASPGVLEVNLTKGVGKVKGSQKGQSGTRELAQIKQLHPRLKGAKGKGKFLDSGKTSSCRREAHGRNCGPP